ncbi:MAG: glycosyltransferase family 2 protein [Candidatus Woesearchaeota archaeon]
MKVVVTIPAYNEERTIGSVINGIRDLKKDYTVFVLDDGSKDGTADVAKKSGAVVCSHPKNYGLAEAFRTEIQQCLKLGADVIVHIDADGQYRASEIPKLVSQIEKGYDLVLGSRFLGTIESMPLIKRLGNRAFSKVISNIVGMRITDGQTGFRAFTKEVAEKVYLISNHTYTQEQIIRAIKLKFRVKEVPAYFAKRKDKSRLISNPFEYAVKAWINIFRIYRDYEPLKFFGIFGTIFLALGIAGGIRLLWFYFTTGLVGHIPTMMLTAILIIVGVFIWLFAFLADMLKK